MPILQENNSEFRASQVYLVVLSVQWVLVLQVVNGSCKRLDVDHYKMGPEPMVIHMEPTPYPLGKGEKSPNYQFLDSMLVVEGVNGVK